MAGRTLALSLNADLHTHPKRKHTAKMRDKSALQIASRCTAALFLRSELIQRPRFWSHARPAPPPSSQTNTKKTHRRW